MLRCDVNGVSVNPQNGMALPPAARTGVLRCLDPETSMPVREQAVKNGALTGPVRYFRDGVLVREQMTDQQGNLQGPSREFGPKGQVLSDISYDNGLKSGLARSFYPNGKLDRATFYGPEGELAFAEFTTRGELSSLHCGDKPLLAPAVDDARLCGFPSRMSQLFFMSESGMVRARGRYLAGKRLRFETFQENGMPAQLEETTGTTRVERTFGADGAKRREVTWSIANGVPTREMEQEFTASGALTRERRWTLGELSSESTYFPDGRPRSKARYTLVGASRVLETREFHDNGVLSAEGRYIDTGRYAPTPTGIHRKFDLKGQIKSETRFDARGRMQRERTWDVAGNLVRDDEVLEDGSRRTAMGATASAP